MPPRIPSADPGTPAKAISARETEVLSLIDARMTNTEIARRLHISIRTVENHVSSLLRKYHVTDRRALANAAHQVADPQAPGWADIPQPLTTFVGRAHERDATMAQLSDFRLITLVGPGGVGKTRLATMVASEVATELSSGAAFVNLMPIHDASLTQAIAGAIGVSQSTDDDLFTAIVGRLRHGDALLIIDNCEHMVESAASAIDRLIAACPKISVLATSRERLGLPGERVVTVDPLPLASDAETLFYDRARSVDPSFEADPAVVGEICARLDGMPLAIELAASRSASLSAPDLLRALDDNLRVLAGNRGHDHRHRSMRSVIEWSHRLLADDERTLFRRLGVFAATFDLDAAVEISGDESVTRTADVLGRLVDKSLVVKQRTNRPGWRLLETIRTFAREQLSSSGEHATIVHRHLHWATTTAQRLDDQPADSWHDEFDAVIDDLRLALSATPAEQDSTAYRLGRSLARLTFERRFVQESVDHYRSAAERATSTTAAAACLRTAAAGVFAFGHAGQAYDLLLAAADRARAGGDGSSMAAALTEAVVLAARMPSGFVTVPAHGDLVAMLEEAAAVDDSTDEKLTALLAAAKAWTRNPEKLRPDPQLTRAAVRAADASGDAVLKSASRDALCAIEADDGHILAAHDIAQHRLDLLPAMDRRDPRAAAEALDVLLGATTCALAAGNLPTALKIGHMVLQDDVIGRHPYRGTSRLIPALVLMGEFDAAFQYADAMWRGWEQTGRPAAAWMSPGVAAVALAHGLRGDLAALMRWRERAAAAAGGKDSAGYARNTAAFVAFVDARVAVHLLTQGRDEKLRYTNVGHPTELVMNAFGEFPTNWHTAYARAAGAELAVVAGLADATDFVHRAELVADQNLWATACLMRARGRMRSGGAAAESLTAAVAAWERIGASFEADVTAGVLASSR